MKRLILLNVLLSTMFALVGCTDEAKKASELTESPAAAIERALAETRALAEAGDPEAQFKLGDIYAEGKVVPNDFAEAARWFQKAGDQGHAEALYFLGIIYANGFSVPVDFTEAYVLFCLSAKTGFELASNDCDALAGEISPEELELANASIEERYETIQQL